MSRARSVTETTRFTPLVIDVVLQLRTFTTSVLRVRPAL